MLRGSEPPGYRRIASMNLCMQSKNMRVNQPQWTISTSEYMLSLAVCGAWSYLPTRNNSSRYGSHHNRQKIVWDCVSVHSLWNGMIHVDPIHMSSSTSNHCYHCIGLRQNLQDTMVLFPCKIYRGVLNKNNKSNQRTRMQSRKTLLWNNLFQQFCTFFLC